MMWFKKLKQSLFALGSVYSAKASDAEQTTDTNNNIQLEHNIVKNPNWLFTSVAGICTQS